MNDRNLHVALLVGLVLRVFAMVLRQGEPCIRDECIYEAMASALMDGHGILAADEWLWAPAYPALLAAHGLISGGSARSVEITQILVALAAAIMLYELAGDLFSRRAGRIAAWLYLLNPTFVFYTATRWSETIYAAVLLAGLLALRSAREGDHRRGWLPGLVVGVCVLFRGVATYILPLFLIGLLWDRWRSAAAWKGAAACLLMAVLTVAPYSIYASRKFGGLVISDRTLGQMMWLGNNDFPPLTFDYGNGVLVAQDYLRVTAAGRPHCVHAEDLIRRDDCERANGLAWIQAHPGEFLERVPVRVAQLLNPHSFLTRHLRWGLWTGLPDWFDELLIVAVAAFSFLTVAVGTFGWVTKGSGWFAATAGLIVFYHIAVISVLAGLSRYRVPLEPLWLVFASAVLAAPREPIPRVRKVGGILLTAIAMGFMLVHLPAGWPWWRSW